MDAENPPWYAEGLRFTCTQCGDCCTGAPGFVWVDDDEIADLARHVGLSVVAFTKKYVRRVSDRLSLVEKPGGDCIFWDKAAGCTVYPARPTQCRTWPFWPENVETRAEWDRVCSICPGAGKGKRHSLVEIQEAVDRTPF